MPRADGRASDEIRPVKITRSFTSATPGSVLYESGRTKVLVTCSVEEEQLNRPNAALQAAPVIRRE